MASMAKYRGLCNVAVWETQAVKLYHSQSMTGSAFTLASVDSQGRKAVWWVNIQLVWRKRVTTGANCSSEMPLQFDLALWISWLYPGLLLLSVVLLHCHHSVVPGVWSKVANAPGYFLCEEKSWSFEQERLSIPSNLGINYGLAFRAAAN